MLKVNKKDFNKDMQVRISADFIAYGSMVYMDDMDNNTCGVFTQKEIDSIKLPSKGAELEIIKVTKYDYPKVWYKEKGVDPIIMNGREVIFRAFWIEFKKATELL